MKQCAACKETKSLSEFYDEGRTSLIVGKRLDGKVPYCRDCTKVRAKEYRDRKRAENLELWRLNQRRHQRKYNYGLTQEQYDAMLLAQGCVCAICNAEPIGNGKWSILYVDHNHKTGKIRKLLCKDCNDLIARAEEDISILESAIQYLKENN